MKIRFKLLKYIFITFVFISFAYINTKAWTRDCSRIEKDIELLEKQFNVNCHDAGGRDDDDFCRAFASEISQAKKWKSDNCEASYCAVHDFDDRNLGIGLDQSGYIIHKYTKGDIGIFCIDPDHIYKKCADYHEQASHHAQNPYIAKLIKAYQELGGNNGGDELYIGTQLYIWDILGLHRTIGGSNYQHIRDMLDNKIKELEGNYSPNLGGTHIVEFKKDYSLNDSNNVLAKGGYQITSKSKGFSKAELNGNSITVNVDSLYPLVKNINVDPTRGSIENLEGIAYVGHSYSQKLFSFNAPLGEIYQPAEVSFKLKTGDLKITKIDEFGEKLKKGVIFNLYFGIPFDSDTCEKGNQIFKEDGSDWITDDNSEIYIKDTLPQGCYVIEEKKTLDPYVYDGQPYSILIKNDEITNFTMTNLNRNISMKILKKDKEDGQFLNETTFKVWDISNKLANETDSNPIDDFYFIKVNQSVDLNNLFSTNNKKYHIVDPVEDFSNDVKEVSINKAASLENNILTTFKPSSIKVRSDNIVHNIYIVANDSEIKQDNYFSIKAMPIFEGTTGYKYLQVVDKDNHLLPVKNANFDFYLDEQASQLYKSYQTNELGILDLNKTEKLNEEAPNILYYKNYDDEVLKISKDEFNNPFDLEGNLFIPYLKAGRKYLVCEEKPTENYSVIDSSCHVVSTYEENYPENVSEVSFEYFNEKGKGDLNILKLNEWLENKGSGNQFQIYKAKLNDENLPYYKNYQNIALDENGKPIIDGEAISYKGTNIFTINDNSYPIIDHLSYGYYIIKEIKTTDMYTDNDDEYLLYIAYSKINNLKFINNNRNVSITLTKKDLEENFRKINNAGYVLYDISKTLDNDNINTNYGYQNIENLKLDNKDIINSLSNYYKRNIIEKEDSIQTYPLENLYFIKTNKLIDLRKFLIESDEQLNKETKNLPIVWKLEGGKDLTINTNNQLMALEPSMFTVKAYGGKYELYGTIDNPKIYQNEVFDPYEDLKFFTTNNIDDEIEVKKLSYITKKDSKDLDTTKIGKYEITYTLISKDDTLYSFDRTIEVIKDERNLPLKDKNNRYYIEKDNNKIYLEYDIEKEKFYYFKDDEAVYLNEYDSLNYKKENKIIPIILNEQKIPNDYLNKELGNWIIMVEGNEDLFKDDTYITKALKLQKAKTGTSFIQTINELNHNLYLSNQEIVLYFDKELKYPLAILNTDEIGEVSLDDFKVQKIEDENKNIEYLFSTNNPNIKLLSNKFNYIENDDKTFTVRTFEKDSKNNFKPIDKKVTQIPFLSSKLYYESSILKDKVYEIDIENINQDGILTFNNLKFDRKYLLCEEVLPEGYDYLSDGNTCMYLDTNNYQENESDKNYTVFNKKRRVDLVLYKTNTQKAIKLDGAIFDVWNISEEGKDLNDLTNEIKVKITKDNLKLIDKPLGMSNKGSCELYQNETNDLVLYPINEKNRLFIYDENKKDLEGTCYQKYEPTLINRSYIGRYITGGIYLKSNLKNHDIGLYSDPLAKNLLKVVKTDDNGETSILGLSNGVYYTKPIRPLKDDFIMNKIDIDGKNIINIPNDSDYVSYDELDSIYQQIDKHYVSKGMIYLPEIKYGSDILFKEIKAPSGYYFDDSNQIIKVKTSYGIKRMENYRINNVIRIPYTGIRL